MKDQRITLRTSEADNEILTKAKTNLEQATGRKLNASKTILASVKMAADNKPDLFFVNRAGIKDIDRSLEAGQKLLQSLVDALRAAVPDITITIGDIEKTCGRTLQTANEKAIREFIVTSLFEKQRGRYPGLQFYRENVIVPDLTEVFEAASKLIMIPSVQWRDVGVYWSCYSLVGAQVQLIPAQIEAVKNQFRCYASTPAERQRLSKVRELCEHLNEFIAGETFNPEKLNIPNVLHYDRDSGRYEPSELYVKYSL